MSFIILKLFNCSSYSEFNYMMCVNLKMFKVFHMSPQKKEKKKKTRFLKKIEISRFLKKFRYFQILKIFEIFRFWKILRFFFDFFWDFFSILKFFDNFFLISIRKICLDETSRNFDFEHSFTSKTYFYDFCNWFALVLLMNYCSISFCTCFIKEFLSLGKT